MQGVGGKTPRLRPMSSSRGRVSIRLPCHDCVLVYWLASLIMAPPSRPTTRSLFGSAVHRVGLLDVRVLGVGARLGAAGRGGRRRGAPRLFAAHHPAELVHHAGFLLGRHMRRMLALELARALAAAAEAAAVAAQQHAEEDDEAGDDDAHDGARCQAAAERVLLLMIIAALLGNGKRRVR